MEENRVIKINDMRGTEGCKDLFCDIKLGVEKPFKRGHRFVPNCQVVGLSKKEARDIVIGLTKLLED